MATLSKKKSIFSSFYNEESWGLLNPHIEQMWKHDMTEKDFKAPIIHMFKVLKWTV